MLVSVKRPPLVSPPELLLQTYIVSPAADADIAIANVFLQSLPHAVALQVVSLVAFTYHVDAAKLIVGNVTR